MNKRDIQKEDDASPYHIDNLVRCFHPRLHHDRACFQIYMSDVCDPELFDKWSAWQETQDAEFSASWHFHVSDILDGFIEMFGCNDGSIDLEEKPVIDAFKKELESMLRKIDALKYS